MMPPQFKVTSRMTKQLYDYYQAKYEESPYLFDWPIITYKQGVWEMMTTQELQDGFWLLTKSILLDHKIDGSFENEGVGRRSLSMYPVFIRFAMCF